MRHYIRLQLIAILIFATLTACGQSSSTPQSSSAPSSKPKEQLPARGEYHHPYKIETKYDKFKDRSDVELNKMSLAHGLELGAYFTYNSNAMKAIPEEVTLYILSQSKTWKYLTSHSLVLILNDNVRLNLGTLKHNGHIGSGYVIEDMYKSVPVNTFLKIAGAQKVEGQLSTTEFTLKQDQIQALKDLASRMSPEETTTK